MDRKQHIEWTKQRALLEMESGTPRDVIASIAQDLNSHPETQNHAAIHLGMILYISGALDKKADIKRFIEGIN